MQSLGQAPYFKKKDNANLGVSWRILGFVVIYICGVNVLYRIIAMCERVAKKGSRKLAYIYPPMVDSPSLS
jgi:hypothetical protein